MGLFKRTLASLSLVALLSVSGTALADENDDTEAFASDTATTLTEDSDAQDSTESTPADGSEDTAPLAPEGNAETSESNEGDDSDTPDDGSVCDVWVSDGDGKETMSISIDDKELLSVDILNDDIDQHGLLNSFEESDFVSYVDFVTLFKDEPEFSGYHGEQKVLVEIEGQTGVSKCADEGKQLAKSAAWLNPYELTVFFPIVSSNPPTTYRMPLYFDDQLLDESRAYVILTSSDSRFGRLADLNGKEMSIDEFLAVMAELEASTDGFPKAGEVYGKHTVKFADFDATYSVITVVYPDKDNDADTDASGAPSSQGNSGAQQANLPAGNTQPNVSGGNSQANASGTVVRAQDMSYRQFLGNSGSRVVPVGPAPAVSSVSSGADGTDGNGKKETEAPNLPVTGDKNKAKKAPDTAAVVGTDAQTTSSHAALFALAACLGLGIVAAVSVIAIRRLKK